MGLFSGCKIKLLNLKNHNLFIINLFVKKLIIYFYCLLLIKRPLFHLNPKIFICPDGEGSSIEIKFGIFVNVFCAIIPYKNILAARL